MRQMTNEELRACQIGILDYFAALCEENDLNWWIDYGTLLGAVRHKGYIPWDDDIDVGMLRVDYDKLIEICRTKQDNRYQFVCVELDPHFSYPFGKVIDTTSLLYEMGEEGIETGVYVDVFVYDDAPDKESRQKIYRNLDRWNRLRRYQLPMGKAPLTIKRLTVLLISGIIKLLPRSYFNRKIVKQARKYSSVKSDVVCDMLFPMYTARWIADKEIFQDMIWLSFEGKQYKAPKRYDEWLTIQYGDYMQLPSVEEQQAAQHDIKAYYIDAL